MRKSPQTDTCKDSPCKGLRYARGLCEKCYHRAYRNGLDEASHMLPKQYPVGGRMLWLRELRKGGYVFFLKSVDHCRYEGCAGRAKLRGLCPACYAAFARFVAAKKTTYKELENLGVLLKRAYG